MRTSESILIDLSRVFTMAFRPVEKCKERYDYCKGNTKICFTPGHTSMTDRKVNLYLFY